MAKKPEEQTTFYPASHFDSEAQRGQDIASDPTAMLPSLPEWGQPKVETSDVLLSALQGLRAATAASADASRLGDPLSAALASIGGAAGAPSPAMIAANRAAMQRQEMLARFEAAPVEAISPTLVAAHPELKGMPLKYVQQIGPILERNQAFRDSHYNLDQAAALSSPDDKPASIARARAQWAQLFPNGQVPKDMVHVAAQNARSQVTVGEKDSQFAIKRITALGDALDPDKARGGQFAQAKGVYTRAERLQSLAGAFPDGNLDSRQIEELAIGLNSMLSGANTGAASQVSALVPKSIIGNAQKLKEWLVNDPQGANQQAFVQRMLGSVEREKATAADQIKRTQLQRTARFADLEQTAPNEFYGQLQAYGIEPDEYRAWKAGGRKPRSAVQGAESTAPSRFKIVAVE